MRCGVAAWVLLTVACAGKVPPPGAGQRVVDVAKMRARMAEARSPVRSFIGEARMTYFGPDGRVRGTATIAVARPASLRYELMGPHGGVIEAFATNGTEMQLLNMTESRFLYGPATVENIDALMAFAPMHLDAAQWVALLFGEVPVPADATLDWDGDVGRYRLQWKEDANTVRLEIDPETARIVRAEVRRAETTMSEVVVKTRDARGLPSAMRLKVPEADVDLKLELRDMEYDPDLGPDVFVLEAPRKATREYLGAP